MKNAGGALGAALRLGVPGVGAICLAGSLLAQGGRFDPWLDVLAHFAPLWLVGAATVALSGLLLDKGKRRVAVLVLGGLGVVASSALMGRELTRPLSPRAGATASRQMRLVQFNAWERNAEPEVVADWIAGEHPEVVTIEDLTPALRKALVARGFRYARGMTNTAVFSRGIPVLTPMAIPPRDWPLLPDFARARFMTPDGAAAFSVVATHLSKPSLGKRWTRAAALSTLLERQPRELLIVAGDFNLTPWSFALRRLDGSLGLERRDRALATWPACPGPVGRFVCSPPFLPIDHIYAGPAWRTVRIRRGPPLGSDHYPLIIDLAREG
jgi:endonuclease/exonuclease/phosphatase (EEP) superfamily protein YafD